MAAKMAEGCGKGGAGVGGGCGRLLRVRQAAAYRFIPLVLHPSIPGNCRLIAGMLPLQLHAALRSSPALPGCLAACLPACQPAHMAATTGSRQGQLRPSARAGPHSLTLEAARAALGTAEGAALGTAERAAVGRRRGAHRHTPVRAARGP